MKSMGIVMSFGVILIVGLGVFLSGKFGAQTRSLVLTFEAQHQGAPFEFDEGTYANPHGAGTFSLRDVRFFASSLVLNHCDCAHEWLIHEFESPLHTCNFFFSTVRAHSLGD